MSNIDTMPAGIKMDVMVAEKVFNVDVYNSARFPDEQYLPRSRQPLYAPSCGSCEQNGLGRGEHEIPEYSTDIAATDTIIDRLAEIGYTAFSLSRDQWSLDHENGLWTAMFSDGNRHYGYGPTRAVAICRAAVRAMDSKEAG